MGHLCRRLARPQVDARGGRDADGSSHVHDPGGRCGGHADCARCWGGLRPCGAAGGHAFDVRGVHAARSGQRDLDVPDCDDGGGLWHRHDRCLDERPRRRDGGEPRAPPDEPCPCGLFLWLRWRLHRHRRDAAGGLVSGLGLGDHGCGGRADGAVDDRAGWPHRRLGAPKNQRWAWAWLGAGHRRWHGVHCLSDGKRGRKLVGPAY